MVHLLIGVIYLAFVSLGLPDALLGSAWPIMHLEFDVPISYAGLLSMVISVGTVISSLLSDRLTYKVGAGRITAISVAMTAIALLGFSVSNSFWMLCLWAIPYGLGAGSVDACLNNYVALHYSSRHMRWLHCMWGLGVAIGPYIMGSVLTGGQHWTAGYRYVGLLQVLIAAVLFISLPIWKPRKTAGNSSSEEEKPLSLPQIFRIPGAKAVMITFFCYCALEQAAGLWASSYLALHKGVPAETAAFFGSMFYIGITAGRALSGFLTLKFSDTQLIRIGQAVIAVGVVAMFLPAGQMVSLIGFVLIGLGCAPIYPCVIHSTPVHFGEARSQALIGVQMASAYTGTCLMPPLFGFLANHIGVSLLPVFLLFFLAAMVLTHERLLRTTEFGKETS